MGLCRWPLWRCDRLHGIENGPETLLQQRPALTTNAMTRAMAKGPLPSPDILRQLLRYEPETGKLFWRFRPREFFESDWPFSRWNTRWAGREAFTAKIAGGYKTGGLFSIDLRAHRVIWAMETGAWPSDQIDHINGVRHDNRMENLRLADQAENMKNAARPSDNTSGFIGVSWSKRKSRWIAYINANGVRHQLGVYRDINDAVSARLSAERRFGFHPNHGR